MKVDIEAESIIINTNGKCGGGGDDGGNDGGDCGGGGGDDGGGGGNGGSCYSIARNGQKMTG